MVLTVIPTQGDFDVFLERCLASGHQMQRTAIGRLALVGIPELALFVSLGGLGKVQFGIQTQHLLNMGEQWRLVICAGAAGALAEGLAPGDVVATETVEHDIKKASSPLVPRYSGSEHYIRSLKRDPLRLPGFQVYYGPIASGDEDVMDLKRKEALRAGTGAIAVAGEGAGGARACHFSGTPFIEMRGITDSCDGNAGADFKLHIGQVMGNLATLASRIVGGEA